MKVMIQIQKIIDFRLEIILNRVKINKRKKIIKNRRKKWKKAYIGFQNL